MAVLFAFSGTSSADENAIEAPNAAPSPEEAVLQAHQLRDAGNAGSAEEILRPVLGIHPDNPHLMSALAEALADQNKTIEATELYEKAVAMVPDNADWRMALADLYLGANQEDSALEHYLILVQTRHQDPALRRRVARLLESMNRVEAAMHHLEAYVGIVPDDAEALENLYRLYLWNDRLDSAVTVLKTLHAMRPNDREIIRTLAERALDQSAEAEAIALYEKALALDPEDLEVRRALGQLYEWNDRPRDALKQYEFFLSKKPFDNEIRARALSLASDLELSRNAHLHAHMLRTGDSRYRDMALRVLLDDSGFGSWVSMDYVFFWEQDRFSYHGIGPRGAWQINDWATVGAWYQFRHHLAGPDDTQTNGNEVLSHTGGLFANFNLPADFILMLDLSYTRYDWDLEGDFLDLGPGKHSWDSVSAGATVSRDIGPASLALFARRADQLVSLPAIYKHVVLNNFGLSIDAAIVDQLLLAGAVEFGLLSDANKRVFGRAGIGWLALQNPRLEIWYEYSIEHYFETRDAADTYYFAPDIYHAHGPRIAWKHAVTLWFAYGIDTRLWHAYGTGGPTDATFKDNALMLSWVADMTFRPGLHHRIKVSFERTDQLWGNTAYRFQDNLLMGRYIYEF